MENSILFADLGISAETLQALTEMGFTTPSPIQAEAIPHLLAGKDVIGQAQTGTGKTAAFAIPCIEMVDAEKRGVQALVMCPTRELAVQVAEEFKKLSKFKRNVRATAVYGGSSIDKQIQAIRQGANVVIGTPGRIMDHIDRGTLKLDAIQMVILDEADEMLNMGFIDDIESILSNTPEERQTVFFSATMPKPIMDLTKRFQENPEIVKVTKKELTVSNIEQFHYEVRMGARTEAMSRLVDMHGLKLMLVFCNTKRMVDELVEELQSRNVAAEAIHGDLRQQQRTTVLAKFKQGVINVLVATDVAARGIDVENVDAVFNYDIPLDDESYVHRIGRTGRAGRAGKSFTFVTGRKDMMKLKDIERYIKSTVPKGEIPSGAEIEVFRKTQFVEKVANMVNADELKDFTDIAQKLQDTGISDAKLIAALSKMLMGNVGNKTYNDDNFKVETRGDRNTPRDRDSRSGGDRFERSGDRDRDRGSRFDRGDRDRDSRSASPSRFGAGNNDRGGESRFGNNSSRGESRFGGNERSSDRGESRFGAPREREPRPVMDPSMKMTKLMINIGKNQRVRPGDIVGAIAGESGVNGKNIGDIEIRDQHTYVYVPKDDASKVMDAMNNNTIKGFKVNFEVAD